MPDDIKIMYALRKNQQSSASIMDLVQPIVLSPRVICGIEGVTIEKDPVRLDVKYHFNGFCLIEMRRGYWLLKNGKHVSKKKIFYLYELRNIIKALTGQEMICL